MITTILRSALRWGHDAGNHLFFMLGSSLVTWSDFETPLGNISAGLACK